MNGKNESLKALASSLAALVIVWPCSGSAPAPKGQLRGVPAGPPRSPAGWTNHFNIPARAAKLHWRSPVKERVVTFHVEPHGKAPELMSVLVASDKAQVERRKRFDEWLTEFRTNHDLMAAKPFLFDHGREQPDFSQAEWVPFQTNVTVDFGPGDGGRWLWVSFKNGHDVNPQWEACHITVQGSPPIIGITNPTQTTTSQPMIQLQGFCTSALESPIRYEVYNQDHVVTAQGEGLVNDTYYDRSLGEITTNYFTCYDVNLSPGTNTFVLHARDRAGYSVTTNWVIVFSTAGKTNPPGFKLEWPQDGMIISGSKFDLFGPCDDATATVTALICDDRGNATRLDGFVERTGCLWVERVPLVEGINYITLITTDAAQNSSLTNLTLGKSKDVLYMDRIANLQQLWQPRIRVTGYYSRTNRSLSINGVKAKMQPDGHWVAENVPVKSPNGGGTASFDMTPDGDGDPMAPSHVWQPTVLGAATNSLQAGLSLIAVSTNEYNHYPLCLGITNRSGKNQPRQWMLPSAEYRFALRLLTKEGKAVPTMDHSHKSGKALPDNLSIHHLGKRELSFVDGIIPVPTNMAVQLVAVNLDQYFQMPPPGEYCLEVQERLFQIAEDGRLVPIALPPVKASLQVIDQPSEMTFFLKQLAQQGKLFLGPALSSMRVGVAYGLHGPGSGEAARIEVFLENLGTNAVRSLRLPRIEEQFDISLYDAAGKELPKTALGRERGLPLTIRSASSTGAPDLSGAIRTLIGIGNPRPSRGFRPVFLSPKAATQINSFKLSELFQPIPLGKYRLTYQQRLYQPGSTNPLTGVTMPTVIVPLEIY